MKTKLSPQELKSLSVLLKQDEVILQQLNENGILDSTKSRAHLIKAEYRQLSDEPKQLKQDLVLFLAKKYNVSVSSIEVIVYSKTVNKYCLCKLCESKITKYKSIKNAGICDDCKPT